MDILLFVIVLIIIIIYQFSKYNKKKSDINNNVQEEFDQKNIIQVRIFKGFWDIKKVRARKNCLFVFGDNEDKVGTGGQAIIRYEPNVVGVPTKLKPYMNEDSFYSDEEFEHNIIAIDDAFKEIRMKLSRKNETGRHYHCLMWPESGLGTGRAELPDRAPRTYEYLLSQVYKLSMELDPEGSESEADNAWGPWLKEQSLKIRERSRKRISI